MFVCACMELSVLLCVCVCLMGRRGLEGASSPQRGKWRIWDCKVEVEENLENASSEKVEEGGK